MLVVMGLIFNSKFLLQIYRKLLEGLDGENGLVIDEAFPVWVGEHVALEFVVLGVVVIDVPELGSVAGKEVLVVVGEGEEVRAGLFLDGWVGFDELEKLEDVLFDVEELGGEAGGGGLIKRYLF